MSIELALLVGAASLLAGVVKGAAAFGYNLVVTPLLIFFIEPRDVLVALVVPMFFMDVLLLVLVAGSVKGQRVFSPSMVIGGLIGAILGAFAIEILDQSTLAIAIGIALVIFALLPNAKQDSESTGVLRVGPGSTVGFIAGITGFFGPPIMLYLQRLRLGRELVVGISASTFIILGLVRGISFGALGLIDSYHLLLALFLIGPAMVGVYIGTKIRGRIKETGFTKIVSYLVVISGFWIIASNILMFTQ